MFIIGAGSLIGLLLVILLSISQLNDSLDKSFRARTKQAVDIAYSQLDFFEGEQRAGRMSQAEAQAGAKKVIASMRFGEHDYFFIVDTNEMMLMHPVKPDRDGKSTHDMKDASGKFHYREMVKTAVDDGAGFVAYDYEVPDTKAVKPKISYVRLFKPWGWIVATGVYNEEIQAAVHEAEIKLGMAVLAIVLVIAGAILVVTRSITLPLSAITGRMRSLAGGDTAAIIPGANRKDEIGAMAGALEIFRQNAEAKVQAEAAKAAADADQQAIVELLSEKLQAMSDGDLTSAITTPVPPSYGALRDNFNTALDNLRELISVLSEASRSIETGSTEISAASDDLARRTESNAASLEQTSAALQQMNDRLKSSADAADRTVGFTQEAIGIVDSGRTTATEATAAMDRVSESAQGIDNVIEGLDKIAFQTRVLAMNAAVEAGRAGEAGRGFAVVADLVSALAMRAEEEARRAREQLTATQADIVVAVDSVKKVDAALANITTSVSQVHEFIEVVAVDNRAQSSAISEIAAAVGVMDHSTQQNAAMVEQTSAAARNLAGEVSGLTRQAARFKIDNGAPTRTAPAARAARSAPRAAAPARPAPAPAMAGGSDGWASF
ncbi:methyl-accepting chemotaxis protein [Sphingomonas azotifigens]|uniref:methyl-accepting chemotaxis protein n=1 Tax=Sphingomonas azotifigens TaxID=330920 RepID=UPI001FE6A45D|nr:methyl-accepting chemotaxis protein [Sphingomonas azotifigens]